MVRNGSDEYDEYDATVRVPKGEKLARSRDTPNAHRGFTHSGDRKMEHAEIFLKSEGEQESDQPTTTFFVFESQPPAKTREQEEFGEALRALVWLALLNAAELASPHVKRWWYGQVLPFVRARSEGLRQRRASRRAHEPSVLVESGPVEESQGVVAALEAYQASMTSDEARRHFAQALLARQFVDEKMRLLANARIEDGNVPPELAASVQALTAKQVEDCLTLMLGTNPHLLEDVGKLVKREGGPLQLESDRFRQALRLTEDER